MTNGKQIMAIDIKNWAKRQTVKNSTAKCVLLELADRADMNGFCPYGEKIIAETLEMSVRTYERAVKVLEQTGLIERRDLPKNKGKFTGKGTKICIPEDDWQGILENRRRREENSQFRSANPSDKMSDGEETGSEKPCDKMTDGNQKPCDKMTDGTENHPTNCQKPADKLSGGQIVALDYKNKDGILNTIGKTEENTQDVCARARDAPLSFGDFSMVVLGGIAEVLSVKSLPDRTEWLEPLRWAFREEKFSASDCIDLFKLLRNQRWRSGRVTPEIWVKNLPELENLRKTVDKKQPKKQEKNYEQDRESDDEWEKRNAHLLPTGN